MSKEIQLGCGPNKLILRKIGTGTEGFKKTEAGVIVKETNEAVEHKGEVLAIGSKIEDVKVGDVVHHGFHSGAVFAYKEETLLSLNDYEILAIEKK